MNKSQALWTLPIVLMVSQAASAAPELVACDLLDEATASALVGVKLKGYISRSTQVMDGVKISNCMFRSDRQSVRVSLAEYASSAEAGKSFGVARKETAQARIVDNVKIQFTVEDESGIGEKAFWYRLASEQYGITTVKGNRALTVSFHFADATTGTRTIPDLRGRSRAPLQAALRRL